MDDICCMRNQYCNAKLIGRDVGQSKRVVSEEFLPLTLE
jgi:hypothetical protein